MKCVQQITSMGILYLACSDIFWLWYKHPWSLTSGLCPSSSILKNTAFWKLYLFLSSSRSNLLCPLQRTNLNHCQYNCIKICTWDQVLSMRHNRKIYNKNYGKAYEDLKLRQKRNWKINAINQTKPTTMNTNAEENQWRTKSRNSAIQSLIFITDICPPEQGIMEKIYISLHNCQNIWYCDMMPEIVHC